MQPSTVLSTNTDVHYSGPLEIELTWRNIPFVKFGGLKFLEAAHVKDVLALLRFAENPRDRVAGFRVLLLLPGVGPVSAARILDELAAALSGPASLSGVPISKLGYCGTHRRWTCCANPGSSSTRRQCYIAGDTRSFAREIGL